MGIATLNLLPCARTFSKHSLVNRPIQHYSLEPQVLSLLAAYFSFLLTKFCTIKARNKILPSSFDSDLTQLWIVSWFSYS